jgi:hypothetical protein
MSVSAIVVEDLFLYGSNDDDDSNDNDSNDNGEIEKNSKATEIETRDGVEFFIYLYLY